MSDGSIEAWVSAFSERLARINDVRGVLPKHVANPDPEIYQSDNYITVDFETTITGKGLSIYPDNGIVLAAWELGPGHPGVRPGVPAEGGQDAGHRMFYKRAGEFDLDELVRDIEQADFLVAHNAKFELGWLARCGLDLTKVVVWDTMLAEYVLGGNRWVWHHLSLENCGKRWFGTGKFDLISKMFKAGICSSEIPDSWLTSYCCRDVELTRSVFEAQRGHMTATDPALLNVVYTRCLLTPVLADIEKNGMQLDPSRVVELAEQKEIEYAQVQNEIEEVTGGINVNSGPQLAEFLYDTLGFAELTDHRGEPVRTASGRPRTDAATVASLKAKTKKQREFLKLYTRSKELYNELTKYLRKFRDCCLQDNGRLLASFNQSNTRTHRLSSSGLDYSTQFQNFPRSYKPVFTARQDGWLVGEADGAQLEFRVAAHLGRDPAALGDIVSGKDIHAVTAGIIGCSRQDAKAHTFKPLYGGTSGTPDERRYYQFFKDTYGGIAQRQQSWINEVLEHKSLRTEWGLRYYWPDTRMERSGYVRNSTSICNYPVQALATAEIIPIGMVYFWHYLKALDLQMMLVNTVHDSIITELPPEEVDWFHVLSQHCLIEEVYGYLDKVYDIQLVVPLGAGVMTGTHWADDNGKKPIEFTYTAQENMYESTELRERRSRRSN